MEIYQSLPILAALLFVAYAVTLAMGRVKPPLPGWMLAALGSGLFLAWSLYAVVQEGPTGFWPEHTRNLWGAQIWFDLLLAAAAALVFLVPEARRLGVRPLPWVLLVCATGSIGLMAFLARVLYLRMAATRAT